MTTQLADRVAWCSWATDRFLDLAPASIEHRLTDGERDALCALVVYIAALEHHVVRTTGFAAFVPTPALVEVVA